MTQAVSHTDRFSVPPILLRPYSLATMALFIVLLVPVCVRRQSDLINVYLPAAHRLERGEELFQQGYFYPPAFAWTTCPLAHVPPLAARVFFLALSTLSLVVLIRGAWQLSGGLPDCNPALEKREHLTFILGLLVAIYYAIDVMTTQQNDLIVAAIVMLGCQALLSGRDWKSGTLFGLAAGLKCTPLLFAPYLAWRRKWLATILVVVTAIGVNLLPDLTHPSATSRCRLVDWVRFFLAPMADKKYDIGTWGSAIQCNHSLPGVTNRWLTWEMVKQDGKAIAVVRSDRAAPETLKVAALGSILLCVLAALIFTRRNVIDGTIAPSAAALEFSMVLILMLLMSPQSSKPHFCTLFLPGFCLARAALVGRSRLLLGVVLGSVVCGLLSNKDLVGARIYDWVVWHGSITLSAVLLFAGCCIALATLRGKVQHEWEAPLLPRQAA
jgi:hypothetical protein